jgi:glycosyltransferase involved in cell wall biosynthesis
MSDHLKKKNILIILFNLSGSNQGGAQRRYINLFKFLQTSEKDNYFLLMNSSLFKSCLDDDLFNSYKNILTLPVKYERFKTNSHGILNKITLNKEVSGIRRKAGHFKYFVKLFFAWFFLNFQLLKIIRDYNIVSCYTIFAGGFFSWPILKIKNINYIHSYNDASAATVSKKILDFFSSEYWVIKNATKIDFLSEQVAVNLEKKIGKLNNEKKLYSPNSFIDYARFYPVYPKKEIISFCARISSFKRLDILLDAIQILKVKNFNNFEVSIIGEGPLLEELKNFADQNDLKNVIFYGGLPNPEYLLQSSKIFVSVQPDNNYPSQSLLEAMACENAIIASDVGETRTLVTGNEGILVPLKAEKVAEAIQYLLEHSEECERMGRNARQKVLKEHTIEKFADYFLKITE